MLYKNQIIRFGSVFSLLLFSIACSTTTKNHEQVKNDPSIEEYFSEEKVERTVHRVENSRSGTEYREEYLKKNFSDIDIFKQEEMRLTDSSLNSRKASCTNCDEIRVCNKGDRGPAAHKKKIPIKLGPSQKPKLMRQLKTARGKFLNRYYFLRPCDTPEDVSAFIYGTPERVSDLLEWNGSREKWTTGKIIYYQGNDSRPDLVNLFDEYNSFKKEYVVKKGDNLSLIAKKVYGHAGNWKEIFVRNNLKDPDKIYVGQKLSLEYFGEQVIDSASTGGMKLKNTIASIDVENSEVKGGDGSGVSKVCMKSALKERFGYLNI